MIFRSCHVDQCNLFYGFYLIKYNITVFIVFNRGITTHASRRTRADRPPFCWHVVGSRTLDRPRCRTPCDGGRDRRSTGGGDRGGRHRSGRGTFSRCTPALTATVVSSAASWWWSATTPRPGPRHRCCRRPRRRRRRSSSANQTSPAVAAAAAVVVS